MLTIKLILFFLSFLIPGYILVSLLLKDKYPNNLFRLGLGYGLGIYFITIQIFIWIFLLNQSFNYFWFTLLVVTENLVLINFYLNKGVKRESNVLQNIANTLKKLNIRENTILLLILVQIIFIFFNALARPVMTFDSLSMWSYKAKILFYEQSIELKNTEAVNYMGGGGKLNYPWNIPLIQFWLHENLGAYNELAVNFIFLGFFLSTL
ncbi:MAG: hypothetical protein NT091_02295, partial [Candidatus Falkowbacteria bacterium]|nr:hypothetical protein [Candidatus Falkowbacteria bacterium]